MTDSELTDLIQRAGLRLPILVHILGYTRWWLKRADKELLARSQARSYPDPVVEKVAVTAVSDRLKTRELPMTYKDAQEILKVKDVSSLKTDLMHWKDRYVIEEKLEWMGSGMWPRHWGYSIPCGDDNCTQIRIRHSDSLRVSYVSDAQQEQLIALGCKVYSYDSHCFSFPPELLDQVALVVGAHRAPGALKETS